MCVCVCKNRILINPVFLLPKELAKQKNMGGTTHTKGNRNPHPKKRFLFGRQLGKKKEKLENERKKKKWLVCRENSMS